MERVIGWLREGISTAIEEIERRGARDGTMRLPPRRGRSWSACATAAGSSPPAAKRLWRGARTVTDGRVASDTVSTDVPVDDDLLDLEDKHSSNAAIQNSRRMLVRKKRAFELARLLDASQVLAASRERADRARRPL